MNFIEMWGTMGPVAKGIGVILVIMSMISFGVAIERIYTFIQARKQSKLYAPQVAKHLKEGRLKDAKVLRSIPLLDQAALDAVKQWQFTPTLLNGVPVPVIMTVTVNFTLQ